MYPGTHAANEPDRAAAVMAETGETLTYGALEEASVRLARYLHDQGVRKGDHLALLSSNDLRCFVVYWAALRSGLYITAVNRHLSADEVAYIINDSGAKALICSGSCAPLLPLFEQTCPKVSVRLVYDGEISGFESYEEQLAKSSPQPFADQPCGMDMLYSSGTTGQPKGIKRPLPDRQVSEPGDALLELNARMYGMGRDTVYLSPAPLYHAAPLRFGGIVQALGGTVIVMTRFDAEQALAAIEKYRVTHSQWVPTMFVRMLKLPDETRKRYDLSSMRVAVHAAAPCPVDVKRAMLEWWGPIVYEYYGSTEGAGGSFISPQEWVDRPGSVGKAGLGIIHICDDEGAERPSGVPGAIYFERDELPFRYHNDDEKTRSAIHPTHQTWTTTGDVGYLDESGYLYLTDRKAFLIISGGVNIYPQEVENCLALHEAVQDVAVIGVPDPEMGQKVKALVQPAPGVKGDEALAGQLIEFVRSKIAHYKAPKLVEFVETLPRTPTGKLRKADLMREAARS